MRTTALLLVVVSAIATAAVWATTGGLQAWTLEDVRRLRVQEMPPVLSALELRSSSGPSFVPWAGPGSARQIWLVNFMYTRCPTQCTTLGVEFERLQRALGREPIRLLSVSFDPLHDDARALRAYAAQYHADPGRWIVAAPASAAALARLEREAGVVVINDGLGGYIHNAAIHVVLDDGQLVRIFDFDDPEAALTWARGLL